MCKPIISSEKGIYININEFKKIKRDLTICFLFIKRLTTKINILKFNTILNNDPAII